MRRIAFATWRGSPAATADDRLAVSPLAARGIAVEARPWSEAVDWTRFEAVVLRSCWDYHVRFARFLGWLDRLEAHGVRVVNPAPTVRWNADKRYLEELARGGIPIEPTVWVATGEEASLAAILAAEGWNEAVVKPVVSASARHTWRTTRASAPGHEPTFARLVGRAPVMVQRLNPLVREAGEWSLVFFAGRYSHAVLKRPAPGEFLVQEARGGTVAAGRPPPGVVRAAERALELAAGGVVYARVDGIADQDRLVVMEIELIEPSLFLGAAAAAPGRFAEAIAATL